MGLPRAIEGARHTGMRVTWTREDGTVQDLTGATLSGEILDSAGVARAITGTLTATSPASGLFTWAYSAADVGTVGRFLVQFKANYGSTYDLTFPEPWVVEPSL